MRVLILDCREMVKDSIRSVVQEAVPGVNITEIDSLGTFFRSTLEIEEKDLIIISPASFGEESDGCLHAALRLYEDVPFIALNDGPISLESQASGVESIHVVPYNVGKASLREKIREVLFEEISSSKPSEVLNYTAPIEERKHPSALLSKRQRQIMVLLAAGLSNDEIAKQLNIAIGTVKSHNHVIYKMLNVTSRTKAILEYQRRFPTENGS